MQGKQLPEFPKTQPIIIEVENCDNYITSISLLGAFKNLYLPDLGIPVNIEIKTPYEEKFSYRELLADIAAKTYGRSSRLDSRHGYCVNVLMVATSRGDGKPDDTMLPKEINIRQSNKFGNWSDYSCKVEQLSFSDSQQEGLNEIASIIGINPAIIIDGGTAIKFDIYPQTKVHFLLYPVENEEEKKQREKMMAANEKRQQEVDKSASYAGKITEPNNNKSTKGKVIQLGDEIVK